MGRLSGLVRRPVPSRSRRDERGAIIPMVAMLLVVLIPSTAIAVDLGMQRVVRRDMQALADVVALDLVRLVDGRTAAQINSGYNGLPTLDAAAGQERRPEHRRPRRPAAGDGQARLHEPRRPTSSTPWSGPAGSPTTKEATGSEIPTAARGQGPGRHRLRLRARQGRRGADRRSPCPRPRRASGSGRSPPGVDVQDSDLLNALMPGLINNSTFSTTLVGYQGLASADIDLLDLAGVSSLGVASPDALLGAGRAHARPVLRGGGERAAGQRRRHGLGHPPAEPQHQGEPDQPHRDPGRARHRVRQHRRAGRDVQRARPRRRRGVRRQRDQLLRRARSRDPGARADQPDDLGRRRRQAEAGLRWRRVSARAQTGQVDLSISGNLVDVSTVSPGRT